MNRKPRARKPRVVMIERLHAITKALTESKTWWQWLHTDHGRRTSARLGTATPETSAAEWDHLGNVLTTRARDLFELATFCHTEAERLRKVAEQ